MRRGTSRLKDFLESPRPRRPRRRGRLPAFQRVPPLLRRSRDGMVSKINKISKIDKLNYLQETLDAFLMVQRTWMYLEPIFGSEDIMRQMPTEGRRFAAVDSFWRRTLAETLKNPRAIDIAENEKLLSQFNATMAIENAGFSQAVPALRSPSMKRFAGLCFE